MYLRHLIVIILAIFVHTSPTYAASKNQFVEKTMQNFLNNTHAPGAAVVIVRDGKAEVYVFGKADISKNKAVTTNTIFEVGSITKLFTALLLADDVVQHRLQLTDNITQLMPEVEKNWVMRRITLAQLATHTAGFPFEPPDSIKTPEDLKKYLLEWKPFPSSKPIYQYSNIGIGLLGRLLENHDHKNINQLYIERILSPLHMSPIGFNVPENLRSDFAQGYMSNGKPAAHSDADLFSAGYDLKLTIKDLSQFLQASLNLSGTPAELAEAIKLSQIPQVQLKNFQQGLGWQINTFKNTTELMKKLNVTILKSTPYQLLPKDEQRFNPKALIEKTGATDGFRAYIALLPNTRSGVAIMTNRAVESNRLVGTARALLLQKSVTQIKHYRSS